MEISIREISLDDAETITTLSYQLGYEISMEQTRFNIQQILKSKDNCAFVAIADEKVIGWIHAFKTMRIESPPFIEIAGLVVDIDYHGNGVGKTLVRKISDWSYAANNSTLRVRCNIKRLEAHKFYTSIGFKQIKEQKVFAMEL